MCSSDLSIWGNFRAFQVAEGSPFIYKGTNPDIDSYSAFWDNSKLSQTSLVSEMKSKGVTDVYVCGLAYDVCVGKRLTHFEAEASNH